MIILRKIKSAIIKINRSKYQKSIQKRNSNQTFTLITNNCVGGIIYHDLGLKFRSPTINLYISGEEYLTFVKNLDYYLKCEVVEMTDVNVNFPVGVLMPKDSKHTPVRLFFQHYKTFQEAKEKWNERCKRVNFDNIFYFWEFYDDVYDVALIKEFDSLPIKKMCLLHNEIEGINNKVIFDCYDSGEQMGRIFANDGLSGKRYLDKFDYVSFFNGL